MKTNYYTRVAALAAVSLATAGSIHAAPVSAPQGVDLNNTGLVYNADYVPIASQWSGSWLAAGFYPTLVAPVSQFTGIGKNGTPIPIADLIPFRSTSYQFVNPVTGVISYMPVAANNGLTQNVQTIQLGGGLVQNTTITQGSANLILDQNGVGKVGIGTSQPLTSLHVHSLNQYSGVTMSGSYPRYNLVDTTNYPADQAPTWGIDSHLGNFRVFRQDSITTPGDVYFNVRDDGHVFVNRTMSIGTGEQKAVFHVAAPAANNIFATGSRSYFFPSSNLAMDSLPGTALVASIVADSTIISQGSVVAFNGTLVNSDSRFKKVVGLSDAGKDLDLLNRIKITDYTYVDQIASGDGVHKKVIAQEVEEVLPAAVSKRVDFVPDVFAKAAKVEGTKGEYKITMDKACALKKGDKIRLFNEKNEKAETEVKAVDGSSFSVASDKDFSDGAFVYGVEHSDVRAVDYEAIAMLNVSATQQLAKEVEALKAENTELKEIATEMKELKALVSTLEGKSTETVSISLSK